MTIRKSGGLAPYPGHGLRPSPQQGPRVKNEGEPYFVRGQGSGMKETLKEGKGLVVEGKPVPRCPSSASRTNYTHGRNGTIPALLNGTATPRPHTAPPRVKPEAEPTAEIGRGKRMKVIVNEYAKSRPTPREPRVKPEAVATAEVHKGGRMHNILHKYGTFPGSSRAVPRVKPEAESYFQMSQGRAMSQTLRTDGLQYRNPQPESRVKPEGAHSAHLDRGGRMKNIFDNYGRNPVRSSVPARVKVEGEDNAFLDRGVRMSKLLHESGSLPGAMRPASRNLTEQAKGNAYKGRGSMGTVLKHIGKTTYIYKPGLQKGPLVSSSIE